MSIITVSLLGLLALVAVYDLFTYRIPNWLVAVIILLYPVMLLLSPTSIAWGEALLVSVIGLLVCFGFFALRWMGGGDAKLMAALLLWTGMQQALPFLIVMTLAGGVMTLLLLAMRSGLAMFAPALLLSSRFPRLLKSGEPVPYGVAMAVGMAWVVGMIGVPGLTAL